MTDVAPALAPGQRVLYLGDFDLCGDQIEANTRRTLAEHTDERRWERVALTEEQVDTHGLPPLVISKPDRRYKPTRYYEAAETEALGQGLIVDLLRAPLDDVLGRQERQRAEAAEQLRGRAD